MDMIEKIDMLLRLKPVVVMVFVFVLGLYICKEYRHRFVSSKNDNMRYGDKKTANGIIFGLERNKCCFSPTEDEGHTLVIGGSGSGKTSAVLIPTLRSWGGTSFVIDISGDVYSNVKMEHPIVYYPSSESTVPYNVFGLIDKMTTRNEQDLALERLALALIPQPAQNGTGVAFFKKGGLDILQAALIAFYHTGYDFVEIMKTIVDCSYAELFSQIDNTKDERAIRHINRFHGENENAIGACKGEASEAVQLFAYDEKLAQTIRRPIADEPCVTADSVEKNNVFVILSANDLGVYATLVRIITAQLMDYLSVRPTQNKHNILLALDEFAAFGRLEMAGPLRTFRKNHVRIMLITQSVADLDEVYGSTTRTSMLNNFKFKLVLNCSDVNTQKYIADLIGQETVTTKSETRNANGFFVGSLTSTTKSERKDYIVQPASLANLGDELIVLYPGGAKRLRKNYYFKHGNNR